MFQLNQILQVILPAVVLIHFLFLRAKQASPEKLV